MKGNHWIRYSQVIDFYKLHTTLSSKVLPYEQTGKAILNQKK